MIDTHCHLEQQDYDNDRNLVIERCKKELHAIITSCANPKYLDLTVKLVKNNSGFIFATASLHPIYIKEFSNEEIEKFIERIRFLKNNLVAIGETGLDYKWVKLKKWQENQKRLFKP